MKGGKWLRSRENTCPTRIPDLIHPSFDPHSLSISIGRHSDCAQTSTILPRRLRVAACRSPHSPAREEKMMKERGLAGLRRGHGARKHAITSIRGRAAVTHQSRWRAHWKQWKQTTARTANHRGRLPNTDTPSLSYSSGLLGRWDAPLRAATAARSERGRVSWADAY